MKKLISFAVSLFAAAVITAVPASAWSAGINDMAGLYSQSEIEELEKRQEEVAEITGWNIAVVTTDTGFGTDGIDACDYAEEYCYDTFGSDPDSVVYLIDIDYRWISIDGDLMNYFNSYRFNTMMDECERHYMNYDDVENLESFYYYLEHFYRAGTVEYGTDIGALGDDFEDSIEYYDDDYYYEDGISTGQGVLCGLIAGVIGAIISVSVVIARYKFHYSPSANCYLNSKNIDMYRREDVFVREYTTRTRISDSSSGGGGRSGGSRRSGGSSRSGGRSRGGGGRGGRR